MHEGRWVPAHYDFADMDITIDNGWMFKIDDDMDNDGRCDYKNKTIRLKSVFKMTK